MVGDNSGIKKEQNFGNFVSYHYIIYQESLCVKQLKFDSIMSTVVKIVDFIRAQALNHHQFCALLEEVDTEYGELILHCDVL